MTRDENVVELGSSLKKRKERESGIGRLNTRSSLGSNLDLAMEPNVGLAISETQRDNFFELFFLCETGTGCTSL